MSERLAKAEALFHEALDLPPEQRDAFLRRACGADAELLREVIALLRASGIADHWLKDTDCAAVDPSNLSPARGGILVEEGPGTVVGRYKLLEKIGEGGFGAVYMAEQEEPVRRKVALKIIKLGMDTKSVIARFEAERQALALMDHPNIAKVLDAGATETGRPYFVMELVRGVPMTRFCEENQLGTAERLELFIQVCGAIQHAHQKGIIHRDIKPTNILVTLNDGVPHPMVIDFGVAKAINQRLTEKTLFTNFAQMIGTPAYMSPEQAEMSKLDVDTRSDVYSLGVLLYELLTGTTPFPEERLRRAGYVEMQRIICEEDPPRPSTRITRTAGLKSQSSPAPRPSPLSTDLDWIVMKCLEKDRTRRYETANGLAADLKRHLDNEPVVARPPSRLYRFQKLLRRNKLAFAAAGVISTVLVLGVVVSSWQALRATRAERAQSLMRYQAEEARTRAEANGEMAKAEAARSAQVAQFLRDMLRSVGPSVALGRDTTLLKEILDRTAEHMKQGLTNQPLVVADLQNTIGNVYMELGQYDKAEAMLRAELTARQKLLGPDHPDVGRSLCDLAYTLWSSSLDERFRGKRPEAESLLRRAAAIQLKSPGDENLELATTLDHLMEVLLAEGKQDESEKVGRQALRIRQKLLGGEHRDVAFSLKNLAMVLENKGKPIEAESLYRQALAMQKKLLNSDDRAIGNTLDPLGSFLWHQGRLDEAEPLIRETLELRKKLLPEGHHDVIFSLQCLSNVLREQGKLSEAEAVAREGVALISKVADDENPDVLYNRRHLAKLLREQGKLSDAEAVVRVTIALLRKRSGNEHPELAGELLELATILRAQNKENEAEAATRESVEPATRAITICQQQLQEHPDQSEYPIRLGHNQWRLGDTLAGLGRREEAVEVFRESVQMFDKASQNLPAEDYLRQEAAFSRRRLADLLVEQGQVDEAVSLYRQAIDSYLALATGEPQSLFYRQEEAYSTWMLAGILASAGRSDSAVTEYRQAITLLEKGLADFPDGETKFQSWLAYNRSQLAGVLSRQGKWAEAEPLFRDEIQALRTRLPADDPQLASMLAQLTTALLQGEKFADAEPVARECLVIREKKMPDDWLTFNARAMLGGSLLGQKKYEDAEPLLLSGYEGMELRESKIPPVGKVRLREALQRLAQLCAATGHPDQAAEWRRKMAEFDRSKEQQEP